MTRWTHQTIEDQLREWIGHMRDCDNRQECQREVCRLTHDQAMRLCHEIGWNREGFSFAGKAERAMAAYNAGRPWDVLAGSHLFAWLVPK